MISPLLTGLLHRWPLNDAAGSNRADVVGNLNLTLNGSVGQAAGYVGGPSQGASPLGASFDTTYANCLTLPYNASNDLRFDTDFSLSTWYYQAAVQSTQTAVFSQGQWNSGYNITLFANGPNLEFALDKADPAKVVGLTGVLNATGWFFLCMRHNAATKTFTIFCAHVASGTQSYVEKSYSGTLTRSTLPFRLNGLSNSGSSVPAVGTFRLQEVNYWNRPLSDDEQMALWNAGAGDVAPFTNCYPNAEEIPTKDKSVRFAVSSLDTPYAGIGFANSLNADTSRVMLRPGKTTMAAQFEFVNSQAAISQGEETGLNSTTGGRITIEAATYYVPGRMAAPLPLSFNGAPGIALNYGEKVLADPIALTLYAGVGVYVSTYYSLQGGFTKVPQRFQITSPGAGLAGGGNKVNSINNGDFTNLASVNYCFGPSIIKGRIWGAAAVRDIDVVLRGDSIAANPGTTYYNLIKNAGLAGQIVALAGEATFHLAPAASRDNMRTQMVRGNERLIDQYGTNDLRGAQRTFAQLKVDKGTLWKRWLGTGSSVRSMMVTTLLPMTEGSALNQANANAQRGPWNTFWRSGASSQDASDMTGRPTLLHRWNGSSWVAAGSRGTGQGQRLDMYLLDVAAVYETDHVANSNTWNTAPVAGKIVVGSSTIADGIHPLTGDGASGATVLQPQFNAWALAALPPLDYTPPVSPLLFPESVTQNEVALRFVQSGETTVLKVFRDGTLSETVQLGQEVPQFTDTTVTPGSTYAYTATALDSFGNESAPGPALEVTVPRPDKVRVVFDYGFGGTGVVGEFRFSLVSMGAGSSQPLVIGEEWQQVESSITVTSGSDGEAQVFLPPAPEGARWKVVSPSGEEFAIDVRDADVGQTVELEGILVR